MLERSVLAIRRRPRRTTNSIGRSFVKFSLSIDPRIDILISVVHLGRSRIEKRQVNKCFFNGASRSSLILRPIVPNLSTIQHFPSHPSTYPESFHLQTSIGYDPSIVPVSSFRTRFSIFDPSYYDDYFRIRIPHEIINRDGTPRCPTARGASSVSPVFDAIPVLRFRK